MFDGLRIKRAVRSAERFEHLVLKEPRGQNGIILKQYLPVDVATDVRSTCAPATGSCPTVLGGPATLVILTPPTSSSQDSSLSTGYLFRTI